MATAETELLQALPARPLSGRTYECLVFLSPEADGGFSVIAPMLPGAASQGDTIEEAIANIREALEGALAEYLDSDGEIPWTSPLEVMPMQCTIQKRILVDV